jgi:protein-S-isoprenylcysteine O-methyltransferase Ste14
LVKKKAGGPDSLSIIEILTESPSDTLVAGVFGDQEEKMSEVADRPINRNLHSGVRYIIQRMTIFLIFAMILFAAAGTLNWRRGWVYFLYMLFIEVCTLIILARKVPETLNRRGALQVGVKTFDKVFVAVWLALVLITPIVAGVDAVRFRWSQMTNAAIYVGAAIIAVMSILGLWAIVENEHFEQFVRIQTDRRHRVVTSGPYRIVRHPGYAGSVLGALGVPLMLGSWWTFAPTGAVILLFIIRTALEDQTLRKELEGYEAYAQQTRFRLLPGIW